MRGIWDLGIRVHRSAGRSGGHGGSPAPLPLGEGVLWVVDSWVGDPEAFPMKHTRKNKKRKALTGGKAVDGHCRNNRWCPVCRSNREPSKRAVELLDGLALVADEANLEHWKPFTAWPGYFFFEALDDYSEPEGQEWIEEVNHWLRIKNHPWDYRRSHAEIEAWVVYNGVPWRESA